MPSASRTLVINRPPAEVFAFFSDPANDPTWRSAVQDIHAHGEPAVGEVIHQTIAGPMGRGIAADIEITAYDPPNRYAFQVVAGPARPAGEFTFAPSGEGTEVTFSLSAELAGVKKLLMGGPVQKSMDGEMAGLDRAKAALETA
jgi:carbon monoxide dehydrogenase subunit G